MSVLTVPPGNRRHVEKPSFNISAYLQPNVYSTLYSSKAGTTTGLVPRLLLVLLPNTEPTMPDGSPLPLDEVNTQFVEADRLLFMPVIFDNVPTAIIASMVLCVLNAVAHDDLGQPEPTDMYVSDAVFDKFLEIENENIKPIKAAIDKRGGLGTTSYSKIGSNILPLIGVMSMVDKALQQVLLFVHDLCSIYAD